MHAHPAPCGHIGVIAGFRRTLRAVSRRTGIPAQDILSRGRQHRVAVARQEVMRLLARQGYSDPRIGLWLDRDPSTVNHGKRAATERMNP